MNWQEKQCRFSIRRFKVGTASVLIGLSFLGLSTQSVQADDYDQSVLATLVATDIGQTEAVSQTEQHGTGSELIVSEPTIADSAPIVADSVPQLETIQAEEAVLASQTLAQQHVPQAQLVSIGLDEPVSPQDFISNLAALPEGTRYEFVSELPVLSPGTMRVVRVRVTFTDGSSTVVAGRLSVPATQAQLNTPEGLSKRVNLRQALEPIELITNASEMPAKTTYSWLTRPNTNTPGGKLARVQVTYPDGSSEIVQIRLVIGRGEVTAPKDKAVPELTWGQVTPSETTTQAEVSYQLQDADNAFVSATVAIYQGEEKLSERGLTKADLAHQVLSFPTWDTLYTIKTSLTYDLGRGQVTTTLPDQTIEFERKQLEIKDVDSISLYSLVGDQFVRQTTLPETLAATETYFVRVASDRFRDMLLPVKSIVSEDLPSGGSAYRVTTDLQELVEDKDPSAQSNYEDQFSFLVKKSPTNPTAITSFKSLIEAIKGNLSGHFVIGADLFADEVSISATDKAYISTEFKGTLTGLSDGQQHAIYNLKAPLFDRLTGASISNLDLKNVAITTNRSGVGTLANEAFAGSRVTDVSVQGAVTAERNVAGVVQNILESTLDNTSFTGSLTMTGTTGPAAMGGIATYLTRGTIQNSYVKADITVTATTNDVRVGGIIGFSNNGVGGASFSGQNILNVYTEGTLTNKGTRGQIGGIIGSNEHSSYPSRLQKVVNKMTVVNGQPVYGSATIRQGSLTEAYTTTGQAQSSVTKLDEVAAATRIAAMGITTSTKDSGTLIEGLQRSTDYTTLPKAMAERKTAYDNIEKLIPFYNKEQIVKYGNLIDPNNKLYQTKLLSVTPMKGTEVISDVNSVKTGLNRLMLHYEDGTVAYLNISYKGDFRNKAISEYTIADTPLIYTPEQFLSSYDGILAEVLPVLEGVAYKSLEMGEQLKTYSQADVLNTIIAKTRAHTGQSLPYVFHNKGTVVTVLMQVIRMSAADANALVLRFENEAIAELSQDLTGIGNQMDKLYLEPTFDQIKSNLTTVIRQILATDKSVNTTGGIVDRYVADYIKANKEKLLMGLAYMQRWYNIDFKETNIKELASYHQDFYGKPVSTLEWLVQLGSSYENLVAANNLTTYATYLAPQTSKSNLLAYLTANRQSFTNYADDNTWFKETSKAYIVEQQSDHLPDRVLRVYDSLSTPAQQNGILPLLSAREGIFIINSWGGLTYGMFDRYYNHAEVRNLPEDQKIAKIKELVDRTAKRHGDHFDVWYRLAPADVRDALAKPTMITWDGYKVGNTWTPMFGAGATNATLDFFGPVGGRSGVANNGSGAYANGTSIYFVNSGVLEDYGSSVYSHEVVHNNDGSIYLGGFGRREGMGPEAFALGLLQSSSYGGHAAGFLTLNLIYDFSSQASATNRDTNIRPERFQEASDLQEYMSGVFDVLYTLDYAEAQAAANLTAAQKVAHYAVIENVAAGVHAGNKIRVLTEDEAQALTSWEKFIDGNIIGRREYGTQEYSRNGYYHSYLFTPNYAALSNPTGAPGDLMFRRIAFELLADKGYEEGFIPYTSNKLKPNATTVLTDNHVLQGIYGDTYASWTETKKAMFQKRIDKRDQLLSVSFTYQGRQVIVNDFSDIERLMNEAMAYDVANKIATTTRNSRVHELKRAIYNAYLRQTNDFEQSIYRN